MYISVTPDSRAASVSEAALVLHGNQTAVFGNSCERNGNSCFGLLYLQKPTDIFVPSGTVEGRRYDQLQQCKQVV